MIRKRIIGQSLLFCIVLSLSFSLANSNTLKVRCLDFTGSNIHPVKVFVQGIRNQEMHDENTKQIGHALFEKLPDDYYRVWAHPLGFAPAFIEFIRLEGGVEQEVTLNFQPGDREKRFYFEDLGVKGQADELMAGGAQALQQGKFKEAEDQLLASLEIYPSNPNTHHNLAVLYIQTSKWEEATKSLNKTKELLQMYMTANDQAKLSLQPQYDEIEKLLETMPLRQLAGEADAAMKAYKYDEAIEKLNQLQQISPDNPTIYYHMAIAYSRSKKFDEAEQAVEKALELKPGEEAFIDLKDRIAKIKESEKANLIRQAVAEVQSLRTAGRNEEALTKAAEIEDQIPEDLKGVYWGEVAQAQLALEKIPEALAAFKIAYESQGKSVEEGLYELAQGMSRKGQNANAKAVYEFILLEVNPDFPEVYYELGMEYFYGEQNSEQAKKMLEKYLEIGTDEAHISNAKNVLAVIAKG